jgi:hypothetical protein
MPATVVCEIDLRSGLPDGIFSNQKSQSGKILEGLGMQKAVWNILWQFGTFYGHVVI